MLTLKALRVIWDRSMWDATSTTNSVKASKLLATQVMSDYIGYTFKEFF